MKTSPQTALLLAGVLVLLLQQAALLAQGSLTPPGAPAPMFKTLTQIEPRTPISTVPITLTSAGSYYLTTNLTETGVADGIVFAASDITLDLNGFTLRGNNDSASGLSVSGTQANLSVRNGTIRNWLTGINFANAGGPFRFENLQVLNNTSNGIYGGAESIISQCYVANNGGHGIVAANQPFAIRDCTVSRNTLDGIRVGATALVVGNVLYGAGSGLGTSNALIRVTGNRSRIENNYLASHDNGVVVGTVGKIIVRNSAANVTTPYNIVVGNTVGPTNSVAGVVTNHPWANFIY